MEESFEEFNKYHIKLNAAIESVAGNIKDATLPQIQDVVRSQGKGLNKDSLLRKVEEFKGSNLADFSAHMSTRNVEMSDSQKRDSWKTGRKPSLDNLR